MGEKEIKGKLEVVYKLITEKLTNSLWQGFNPVRMIWYDKEWAYEMREGKVVTFKKPEIFAGNSIADFEGESVAIWDITTFEKGISEQVAAPYLIHEMFHVYQLNKGWNIEVNELIGIQCPYEARGVGLKEREIHHLYEAIKSENEEDFKAHLKLAITYKEIHLSETEDYTNYDLIIETFEGGAYYVENLARAYFSKTTILSELEKVKSHVKIDEMLKHYRRSGYTIGGLWYSVLQRMAPDFEKSFEESGQTVFEAVKTLIGEFEREAVTLDEAYMDLITKKIAAYEEEKRAVIESFKVPRVGYRKEIIHQPFILGGLDPMNIIKVGNTCLHTRMLLIEKDGEARQLEGPVLTVIGENLFDIQYIERWVK